ncbi:MAG: beta-glucosidase [Bryobacterales bacterium]|nr:beta-glucosidase [Bryobacterales bacterium]
MLPLAAWVALSANAQEHTFGVTTVSTSALQGKVYLLRPGAGRLPNFGKMNPAGAVYANSLNVWPQSFNAGFPGVTGRHEWFAIDYHGKFWIEDAGAYRFSLLADDGARLWIDDKLIVDLDGTHGAIGASGSATLSRGVHRIRVAYYQGPAFAVALVLAIARPESPWKIFHTDDYLPPKDPAQWTEGRISNIQSLPNPYARN